MSSENKKLNIAFFGGEEFSVTIADKLFSEGFKPSLVITTPDKPKGRGLKMESTPLKKWAQDRGIKILTPNSLNNSEIEKEIINNSETKEWDLFITASYGKIIPDSILGIPKKGNINVHTSLLPKFRGASPIEYAILEGEAETGVTIMLMDKMMDHGPVLAQEIVSITEDETSITLKNKLANVGSRLLVETLPKWVNKEIEAKTQNESDATYTVKIEKPAAEIDLNDDPIINYRKIRAYKEWPEAYYFVEKNGKNIRVKIKNAEIKEGKLVIKRVLPEGKKEMDYEIFMRGM